MIYGNKPADGTGKEPKQEGKLIIEAKDYDYFIENEPNSKKYIRPYIGSEEFINGKDRYCLWLKDCPQDEIDKMPLVKLRVEKVRNFRLASKKLATKRKAKTPTLFTEDRYVESDSIFMPMVSSENRQYVPVGFINDKAIINNKSLFIPNANIYIFGILISKIHMSWMRSICGRLKSDYSYSTTIVYNNFVWPSPSAKERKKIEQTAQNILNERKALINYSLADMYDDKHMPKKLYEAHQANDKAVMAAYNFDEKMTESEIVAELMKKYQKLISSLHN